MSLKQFCDACGSEIKPDTEHGAIQNIGSNGSVEFENDLCLKCVRIAERAVSAAARGKRKKS